MSKKTFTFLILFLLVIIGVLGWYFFLRTGPGGTGNNGTSTGSDLFPFGQKPVATSTTGQTGGNNGSSTVIDITGNTNVPVPRLRQLWKDPTAGEGFLTSGSSTLSVRFVDRATGHVYEAPVDTLGNTQLSNVTIPQVYEASFASNGNEMIMRYLKDDNSIQSFYARLSTSTISTSGPLEGYFLPQNIRDIALLGSKILYFDPAVSTGSLVLANVNGTNRLSIMSSDLLDWTMSWNATSTIFLSTRPSGAVDGHGYLFNIAKGSIAKIVDSIKGLVGNMSPLGQYVFLSAQGGSGMASAAYDTVTQKTTTLTIGTIADKCAWSNKQKSIVYCAVPTLIPPGTYPDDWYQGTVSFSDTLWKIDVAAGTTEIVFDPEFDATQEMDIMKLAIDPTDNYLSFINKKDMSLWLYKF